MTQLLTYKQCIENGEFTPDSLLYQSKSSACDWDENDWILRLVNGLRLNNNRANFTAHDIFNAFQLEVTNRIECRKAYMMHCLPDILLKKSKLLVVLVVHIPLMIVQVTSLYPH